MSDTTAAPHISPAVPVAARTSLANVNLFVRDPERSRRFYVEALGLRDDARSAPPDFVLLDAGGGCTLTLQAAGPMGEPLDRLGGVELGFELADAAALEPARAPRGDRRQRGGRECDGVGARVRRPRPGRAPAQRVRAIGRRAAAAHRRGTRAGHGAAGRPTLTRWAHSGAVERILRTNVRRPERSIGRASRAAARRAVARQPRPASALLAPGPAVRSRTAVPQGSRTMTASAAAASTA